MSYIKRAFVCGCVCFPIILLIYIGITAIVNPDEKLLIDGVRTVLFFAFALFLGAADTLFSIKSISGGVRFALHFMITLSGAFTCVILPWILTSSLRTETYLVGAGVCVVVYIAIMAIWQLILTKFKANLDQPETYEKMFSKKPSGNEISNNKAKKK